ncbi:MAG: endo-1,4-beta-xylanase, partial [bacterium]|nr:endo-1,4-beta-xylanase [bacterium]
MRAWISLLAVLLGAGCMSNDVGSNGRDLSAGGASDLSAGDVGDAAVNHDAAVPVGTACANPPCINVINACPFALWIHAANNAITLMPDGAQLAAGATRQYDVPASWPAARVNAYWVDPNGAGTDPNGFDKVELTIGGGVMNYNITYVDYLALPARMEAIGPSCAKTPTYDPPVACAVPVGQILSGCPAGLLDGILCLSAGLYCSIAANRAGAFCHALDTPLQSCETQNASTCGIAGQLGNGTPEVYACAGYFDSQPPSCSPASTTCHLDGNKWCAALNRGMLAQPTSTNAALYYQTAPYNP